MGGQAICLSTYVAISLVECDDEKAIVSIGCRVAGEIVRALIFISGSIDYLRVTFRGEIWVGVLFLFCSHECFDLFLSL